MKRAVLCITGVFILMNIMSAQTGSDFLSLKNFTPPSPESAAMQRYGDIPVDLSTGLVQISIPVYEIKSRQLSLPITLSYHASGIKVQDVATPVGLGWVLNAGGSVSRSVIGKADEKGIFITPGYGGFKSRQSLENAQYNLSDNTNFNYLSNMSTDWDQQSDLYYFNIPGINGKFVYDTSFAIHYQPVDRQVKIVRTSGNMFYITDDVGVYYEFTEPEKTDTYYAIDTTTWHLTRMISADKRDTITFEYLNAATVSDFERAFTFYIQVPKDEGEGNPCELKAPIFDHTTTDNTYTYYRKLLSRINFSNGFVKLEYISDRQDPAPERLYKIKVCRKDSTIISQFKLNHSYFVSDGTPYVPADSIYFKRLRLDSVQYQSPDSVTGSSYQFNYTASSMPGYRTSTGTKTPAIDYWGYYGIGPSGGIETLLPSEYSDEISTFLTGAYGHSNYNSTVLTAYYNRENDRQPDPNNMQFCLLNKIYYPTGGSSSFEYETHKVDSTGTAADYVGGLRIKKVTSYDSLGNLSLIKSYSYSTGKAISKLLPYNFYYTKQTQTFRNLVNPPYYIWCQSQDFFINGNPFNGINYYNGSPAIYDTVTEISGTASVNIGKTENIFDTELDSIYSSPYLRKYIYFSTDKGWARGHLLKQKTYKKEGSNYVISRELRNEYTSLGKKNIKVGQLCELVTGNSTANLENYLAYLVTHSFSAYLLVHFDYEDVVIPFGVKKLTRSEEIDFLNDTVIKKKEFFYNGSGHLYTSKVYDFGSANGDTLVTKIRYPQDKSAIYNLSSSASEAIDSMVLRNIKSAVIETEFQRNSTLLKIDRTDYANYGSSDRYYPAYLNRQYDFYQMESRVEYKTYDNWGNVTSLRKVNGHTLSYIWDYYGTLPVADVIGAGYDSIAFTSFEAEGKGEWTYSGTPSATYALTGSKSYLCSGGNLTKTGLTNATYIVSYWGRSGSVNVNSSGPTKTGKTIGNWTYYEHEVTGTSITVSGSNYIDELRLYPKGALMNSYTFIPLVGLSSKSDPNGVITFYEYDNFNRLKVVRDEDGNILKLIEYKYKTGSNE